MIITAKQMSTRHNIPASITAKIGRNLHNQTNHPIAIIKDLIFELFPDYSKFSDLQPKVSVYDNFDSLNMEHHISKSPSDTYYLDDTTVLRTHTSAHQNSLLTAGEKKFLVAGDV